MAHLQFTIRSLRREGIVGKDLKEIFHYDCPVCRVIIKKPPVDCLIAWNTLAGIREAMEGRTDLLPNPKNVVDESLVTGAVFFEGLFFHTYDPTEYNFRG